MDFEQGIRNKQPNPDRSPRAPSQAAVSRLYAHQSSLAVSSLADLPRKPRLGTSRQDIAACNPGRADPAHDLRTNCVRAVHAFLLRRLGFDVIAGEGEYSSPYIPGESTAEASLRAWRTGGGRPPRSVRLDRSTALLRLEAMPRGSRGILSLAIARPDGSPQRVRHALVWECANGRLVVSDPQSGVYNRLDLMTSDIYSDEEVMVARLDQAHPTDEVIDVVDPRMRKGPVR